MMLTRSSLLGLNMKPNEQLRTLLREAYGPCPFFGRCREAVWAPESGHIPRGYLGATRALADVELVMVFSEPGSPHQGERYDSSLGEDLLIDACSEHAYQSFRDGSDLFHRNVRWFLSQVYPESTFDEQLQKVWLTEGRLCSIKDEIAGTMDRTCAQHYLTGQLALVSQATIVAFGQKARRYLDGLGAEYVPAYSLAPPGANHKPARPSWEAAIDLVKSRRLARIK